MLKLKTKDIKGFIKYDICRKGNYKHNMYNASVPKTVLCHMTSHGLCSPVLSTQLKVLDHAISARPRFPILGFAMPPLEETF